MAERIVLVRDESKLLEQIARRAGLSPGDMLRALIAAEAQRQLMGPRSAEAGTPDPEGDPRGVRQ